MPFILPSGRLNISKYESKFPYCKLFQAFRSLLQFHLYVSIPLVSILPIIAHSIFPSAPNNSPEKSNVMMIGHQTRTTEDPLLVLPSFFILIWSHGGQETRLWLVGYDNKLVLPS